MKFVVRRIIAGAVVVPMVAGAYVIGVVGLVALSGDFSMGLADIINNGLLVGAVCGVALVFAPQVNKFVSKIVGE